MGLFGMKRILLLACSIFILSGIAFPQESSSESTSEEPVINTNNFDNLYSENYSESFSDDLENPISKKSIKFSDRDSDGGDMMQLYKFVTTNDNKASYRLFIYYSGSSWRFMDGGIRIKTDKNLIKLNDDSPCRSVGDSGDVYETVSCELTKKQIKDIAYSKVLKIQYWRDPIELRDDEKYMLKKFYEENIK